MNNARDAILARLREKQSENNPIPELYQPEYGWSQQQKIQHLSERMSAVHSEVIDLTNSNWIDWLNHELPKRELNTILIGNTDDGLLFKSSAKQQLHIRSYDNNIEQWKEELFSAIDASITSTVGAIAETGSLVLWPDASEPRLMSLAPPVHIALLRVSTIYETFAQVVQKQNWNQCMPTNALLISGPSKTADIEQTLAYGIHGPQQLIVLLID